MRKSLFTLAAVATVALFTASTASAQCTFDAPGKAKGLKTDMVRAYAPCGSGITFPASNSVTQTGTPSCSPPTPYSAQLFSDKGKCSVKSKTALEAPCSNGNPGNCTNVSIQAKCSGITNNDGVTPATGPGWVLATLSRATLDDQTNGDMTVIDFPVAWDIPALEKGKIKLKSDSNFALLPVLGAGNNLSPCAQIETLSVKIFAPDGVFAVMGSAVR